MFRAIEDKSTALAQFGALVTTADAYDVLTLDTEGLAPRYDIYQRVWGEAQALRWSGALLALGKRNACPVVGIHGGILLDSLNSGTKSESGTCGIAMRFSAYTVLKTVKLE